MAGLGIHTQLCAAIAVLAALSVVHGVAGLEPPPISGSWADRIDAANRIAKNPHLTAQQKFAALVQAIRQEATQPYDQPGVAAHSTGFSHGEFLQVAYMALLWEACGPKMIWEKVKALEGPARKNPEDRELRKRLIIAFACPPYPRKLVGFAAERAQAARELLIMLRTEKYDFLRALAARGLGNLGAREAIPALKEALRDPAYRWVRGLGCFETPSGKDYMVRLEAAMALGNMGLKVHSPNPDTWTVEP